MLSTACEGQKPYSFVHPENMEVFELPQELIEISGLIDVDTTFMAIQDESGSVYLLSPDNFSIKKVMNFAWPGDYEAMVEKDSGLWVVDSRGILFDLKLRGDNFSVNNILQLPENNQEFEGVWQDSDKDKLLLISRKARKRSNVPDERYIWSFDPLEQKLEKSILIPLDEVWQNLMGFSNIDTWRFSVNRNLPFSDLTKDIKSGKWLILCSKPAAIIVLDRSGDLESVIELDNQILPQPEALCFDKHGNLIVASEGLLGPARIVRYRKTHK